MPALVSTVGAIVAIESADGPADAREGGDAEVEHLHVAVGPQHQVVGLDVAMHDRRGMRGRKRRRGLDRDVEDLAKRQRAAREPLAQRLALDELRDEEPRAVVIADLVDGEDVRMIERRSGARFVQEAAHPLRIAGELRPQHLERDRPSQRRIDGLVDLTHPAAAEQVLNLVAADGAPRRSSDIAGKLYRVSGVAVVMQLAAKP